LLNPESVIPLICYENCTHTKLALLKKVTVRKRSTVGAKRLEGQSSFGKNGGETRFISQQTVAVTFAVSDFAMADWKCIAPGESAKSAVNQTFIRRGAGWSACTPAP